MDIGRVLFNPYLYRQGGRISGDYKFSKGANIEMNDDADIELAPEEARLQMQTDPNNYLCFRDSEIYINLDLQVGGNIEAHELEIEKLVINQDLEVHGSTTLDGTLLMKNGVVSQEDVIFEKALTVNTLNVTHGIVAASIASSTATHTSVDASLVTSTVIQGNSGNFGPLHAHDISVYANSSLPYYAQLTLNGDTGHLFLNGGIMCLNNNPLTNAVNPQGVTTDFIQTGVHRSDFGHNGNYESILATGKVTADQFLMGQGGMTPTQLYHSAKLATPLALVTTIKHSDPAVGKINFGLDGMALHGDVSFVTGPIRFTGLTAAQIVDWPLSDQYLSNAGDTNIGVEIFSDSTHQSQGVLQAFNVTAQQGTFRDLVLGLEGTGVIDFTDVEKLDFTGLAPSDIVGWPLIDQYIKHLEDVAGGVKVWADDTHQTLGTITAANAVLSQTTSTNIITDDLVVNTAHLNGNTTFGTLDFTGVATTDITNWPYATHVKDINNGAAVYSDDQYHAYGGFTAGGITTGITTTHDLVVGANGGGNADFTEVNSLDFTGLTASQIIGWPLAMPNGLTHVHDTPTGAFINSNLEVETLKANYIETSDPQNDFLRINGFDQVRVSDDFNVLGATVLNSCHVSGGFTAGVADFDGAVEVNADLIAHKVITYSVGKSDVLRTKYVDQTLPYISHCIGPGTIAMWLKEDQGVGFITTKHVELATRNTFTGIEVDNETNAMRDQFGSTPLSLRQWPRTAGWGDADNTLECFSQDDQYPVAAIRHDGCIWGSNWGFHPDMYTRIASIKVTDANDPNHDIDRLAIVVDEETKVIVGEDRVDFRDNVYAPNVNSSGSFTHCHVCEPEDQVVDYSQLIGRLMESTGQCAVRDDNGALVSDYNLVPGNSYAMASVRLATTSCLGVLNSVESVLDGEIHHPHGIMLKHKVDEADGHKILRVCGAGDAHVWVVKPVASEILLTPSLCSGLFTKYVNGVEQTEKVVLTCHDDLSFQMVVNAPDVITRLAALEAKFAQLTNT